MFPTVMQANASEPASLEPGKAPQSEIVKVLQSGNVTHKPDWFKKAYDEGFRLYVVNATTGADCKPWDATESQLKAAMDAKLKVAVSINDASCWGKALKATGKYKKDIQFLALSVNTTTKVKLTRGMVDGVKKAGVRPVISTNSSDWAKVQGKSNQSFADVALWDTSTQGNFNYREWQPSVSSSGGVSYGGWDNQGANKVGLRVKPGYVFNGSKVTLSAFLDKFLSVGTQADKPGTPTAKPSATSTPKPSVTPRPVSSPKPSATPAPTPTASKPVTTPVPAPVASVAPVGRAYPLHTNIVSSTFWVGELYNESLEDGSQVCSTYDGNWAYRWSGINKGKVPSGAAGCAGSIIGGCDGVVSGDKCLTEKRTAANGFFPTSVPAPKENPFYVALPYDDINDATGFKERCTVIPWANDAGYAGHCNDENFSYMKNRWVKITGPKGAVCYGQIEDSGPSHDNLYHDKNYVFGKNNAQPVQGQWNNAGIDVSPALVGCLGYPEVEGQAKVSWAFVDDAAVPAGPWKKVVTKSGVSG